MRVVLFLDVYAATFSHRKMIGEPEFSSDISGNRPLIPTTHLCLSSAAYLLCIDSADSKTTLVVDEVEATCHLKSLGGSLYQHGFLSGTFSDVEIVALGKEFNLHKVGPVANT